jgi:hypothetical protein
MDDQIAAVDAARKERIIGQHLAEAARAYELDVLRSGVAAPNGVVHLVAEQAPKLREAVEARFEAGELQPMAAESIEELDARERAFEAERVAASQEGRRARMAREDAEAADPQANGAMMLQADLSHGDDRTLLQNLGDLAAVGVDVQVAAREAGGDAFVERIRGAMARTRRAEKGELGAYQIAGREGFWVTDREVQR